MPSCAAVAVALGVFAAVLGAAVRLLDVGDHPADAVAGADVAANTVPAGLAERGALVAPSTLRRAPFSDPSKDASAAELASRDFAHVEVPAVGARIEATSRRREEAVPPRLGVASEVVVVHHDGTPAANVAVSASRRFGDDRDRDGDVCATARTGADGRATLTLRGGAATSPIRIVAETTGCDAASVDASPPFEGPARFVLPPVAELTVLAVDESGRPMDEAGEASLSTLARSASRSAPAGARIEPMSRGRAVFAAVRPGVALRIEARCTFGPYLKGERFVTLEGAGRQVATVPCVRRLRITGRVVDGRGAPRAAVVTAVDAPETPSSTTDASGLYSAWTAFAASSPPPTFAVEAAVEGLRTRIFRFPALRVEDGAAVLPDLVVDDAAFCEGIVFGPDGRPAAGERVVLTRRGRDGSPLSTDVASTSADASGRFRIEDTAPTEASAGVLFAESSEGRSPPVAVARGARDVVLRLDAFAALEVAATTLPDRLNATLVVVGVPAWREVRRDPSEGERRRRFSNVDEALVVDRLTAGVVRVEIVLEERAVCGGRPRPPGKRVLVVDDVTLTPGEVCRDPRLRNLDLAALAGTPAPRRTDATPPE
ncbi:MAG TPA: hypothetical protein VEI02_10645 [Planctomycetota bacterium]|nr:hypothetical protein [Planctomycetota bacterium]